MLEHKLILKREVKTYLRKSAELTHYLILLDDDEMWKSRFQYLQLLENFNSANMNASGIRSQNIENEVDFELPRESRGFAKIVSTIDYLLDLYDPEKTLEMDLEDPESIWAEMSGETLKILLEDFKYL